MITGYEYKKINNEKVLILYLNYDSEFGIDFKLRHKNSSMKKEIKDYIEKNKIKLNSEKIALSFGGIILALLLVIETPKPKDNLDLAYVSDTIIPNEIVEIVRPTESIESNESNEKLEETKTENIKTNEVIVDSNQEVTTNPVQSTTNSTETINTENTTKEDKIKEKNDNNINVNNNTESTTPTIENNIENTVKEDITQPTIIKQPVTIYRTNGEVITLELEEYLVGVVGAEMPASFSIEALKTQAIISRTYALKKIENKEKLTDSVSTQRYKDKEELKKDWGSSFEIYYQKIKTAVESTNGLAIYYQDNLIDAVYHSTSNGKTEDSAEVWGNNIPYLKSVESIWDKDASSYLRETTKDFTNILNLLGINLENDTSLEILSRNDSGRVVEVRVGKKILSGIEFRETLGLRSADFDLTIEDNNLKITTRGYGHGVGLSQYGANGMAKQGYNYEQIIKHYYRGVSIKKI